MYGKIQITGTIEVVTGMHIGGPNAFAAIGAVDAPVVKDVITNKPYIPGSSLKGKLRTLLAKEFDDVLANNPDDDVQRITRLFGSAKKNHVKRSRLLFSDCFLANEEELRSQGLQSLTEIKCENTINRATARATPRQIERTFRGSKFLLQIMYNVEEAEDVIEDFQTLAEGIKLLQYDYLGGNGSRGYGKVQIRDLKAEGVIGDLPDELINQCSEVLQSI